MQVRTGGEERVEDRVCYSICIILGLPGIICSRLPRGGDKEARREEKRELKIGYATVV